jgi:hypothetical protein
MAIYIATHGPRQRQHLDRAKELMLSCSLSFTHLALEGFINEAISKESQRRIEQILLGIDQLATTPVEEWLSLQLPTVAEATASPKQPNALQQMVARVAAAAKLAGPRPTTSSKARTRLVLRKKRNGNGFDRDGVASDRYRGRAGPGE